MTEPRILSANAIDNLWRHWWIGHMHAVGAVSRLSLDPIDEEALQLINAAAVVNPKPPRRRRAPGRKTAILAREIGDIAIDVLDRLILEPDHDEQWKQGTHIAGRRHLVNCDFYLLGEVTEKLDGGGRYYLFAPEGTSTAMELTDMFWPIDMAMVCEKPHDTFFIMRMATVAAKDIRGLVDRVPLKCLAVTSAYVPRQEAWGADTKIVGMLGGRWDILDRPIIRQRVSGIRGDMHYAVIEHPPREELQNNVMLMFGMRLTQRYDWHVALGREAGGERLVLPTNPTGCLELFASRDRAPGEHRRAALRHWVNEHYRQRSADTKTLDYVCEHLRGNTRFSWNGLACELMVSEFDLEKNEFFRQRAAQWRARRQHNRLRVRLK